MQSDVELRAEVSSLLGDFDPHTVDAVTFRGAQFDRGLAWVHFPVGKGGLGLSPSRQVVVSEMLREAKVPYRDFFFNPIGIGMAAPTLLAFGTEQMHDLYLRRIFTAEDIWCQLFSEPDHGSDVAGLACLGIRAGDDWVVNGQKVWTTLAHEARYGLLLLRTDTNLPKHRGLSYFVVDMHSPGVEVRPLFQLTGEAEFNEVFFNNVALPDLNRLGKVGEGWKVAITTLINERSAISSSGGTRGSGAIRHLRRIWEERREEMDAIQRAIWRDRVTQLWIRAENHRLTVARARAHARAGVTGSEGSIGKLVLGEINKQMFETAIDLLGPAGTLHRGGYPMERAGGLVEGIGTRDTSWEFLRSRASSIEGGTSEIQRNILGERILGLPSDIRVDQDIPWRDIPRQIPT